MSGNKIKILIVIMLFCTIASIRVSAQSDSIYINKYEQTYTIKGIAYGNYLMLSTSEINRTNEINYYPNNPVNLGIGFSHKKLPFDISIGYNIGVTSEDNYLKTEQFDLQLNKYEQMYVADVYIQDYRGLYIDDPELSIEESNCYDLSIFQTGLVGQYIFNGKKFSYQAAFNQHEKQLKSVGSWLLGAESYYFSIKSDSSFVFRNKRNIQGFQFGINAGYAYNWVIKKHWLVSCSLSVGANLGNNSIKTFFNKYLYISPTTLSRTSAFYNKENWSLGLEFVINTMSLIYSDDSNLNLGGGRFNITYVQRITYKK